MDSGTSTQTSAGQIMRLDFQDGYAEAEGLVDARPTQVPSQLLQQLQAQLSPGLTTGEAPVRARSTATWSRFPVAYNLEPDTVPTVGAALPMTEPMACYVSDAAIRFSRTWNFPGVDGTYTYRFDWMGPPGSPATASVLVYTLENANTPQVHSILTRTVNSSPTQTLFDLNAAITTFTWNETFLLAAGGLGTLPDSRVETEAMGTWVVHEDLNGVEDTTGTFDLRHFALKNMRAEPVKFVPSSSVPPPESNTTRLKADVFALPVTSELFPTGWGPAGDVAWRLVLFNNDGLLRAFTGTATPHTREQDGRVASIEQVWDGHPEAGSLALVAPGSYDFGGQALADLSGGGQSITRPLFNTVSVGNLRVEIEDLQPNPTSLDPSVEGASVNITADVVTSDFQQPAGNYTLTIKPKSEEVISSKATAFASLGIDPNPLPSPLPPVRTFSGDLTFTDTTAKVSETWDGKSDAGSNFPEGDYTIELHVAVTDGGGGESRMAQATTTVAVGLARLVLQSVQFKTAQGFRDDDGEVVDYPKVYYDRTKQIHHPVVLSLDLPNSSVSSKKVGETQSVELEVSRLETGFQKEEFEFQILDPNAAPLSSVKRESWPKGQHRMKLSLDVELPKAVTRIPFLKIRYREAGTESWNQIAAPLTFPIYITLRGAQEPFRSDPAGGHGPTEGLLDIATVLADGATDDDSVRSRLMQRLCEEGGWLEQKGFIYSPGVFHVRLAREKFGSPPHRNERRKNQSLVFDYEVFSAHLRNPAERFWGDCEDVSAFYAVLCATVGTRMNAKRTVGYYDADIDAILGFDTVPLKACAAQEHQNPGALPGNPPIFRTPFFHAWTFQAHQVAAFQGHVYDPSFLSTTFGLAVKVPSDTFYRGLISQGRANPDPTTFAEIPISDIILPSSFQLR